MDVFKTGLQLLILGFFQKDTCEGKGKTLNLNKSTDTVFFFKAYMHYTIRRCLNLLFLLQRATGL